MVFRFLFLPPDIGQKLFYVCLQLSDTCQELFGISLQFFDIYRKLFPITFPSSKIS